MKKAKQISLSELITKLENKLETLKRFQKYEHYFSHVKGKTQCLYIIELRKVILKEITDAGLNLTDASKILCVKRSSLISMQKKNSAKYIIREVELQKDSWLSEKVYPYTYNNKKHITIKEALEKPFGIEQPYNVCSIYEHHALINLKTINQ